MLTLFYAPDTCALATHVTLIEADAPYRLERISFADGEQRSAGYLATNPKGRVPTLVTPDGVLTETPALLAYVAHAFPSARLAPVEPFAFARVQEFNLFLCATLHVAHAHRMRGHRWADEPDAISAMQRKVPASVSECYRLIEGHMLGTPYVMGDTYTICDPYLFTLAQWLEADGVDPASIPKVVAHRARLAERGSVTRALAEERA